MEGGNKGLPHYFCWSHTATLASKEAAAGFESLREGPPQLRIVEKTTLLLGPKVAVTDYTFFRVTDYTTQIPAAAGGCWRLLAAAGGLLALPVWEHGTVQTSPGITF